jgi:hypothetical protein
MPALRLHGCMEARLILSILAFWGLIANKDGILFCKFMLYSIEMPPYFQEARHNGKFGARPKY